MSVFRAQDVNCPACAKTVSFRVNYSVNADRRPDFRAAILDGSFQRQECPHCGKAFRLEPELTYLDSKRGQWLLVRPAGALADWPVLEEHSGVLFADAFGPGTPPAVAELGRGLKPRVTFGWPALREKLLCADLGLDDATLELTKLALLRGLDDSPVADNVELRLDKVDGADLVMNWVVPTTEAVVEELRVPKALYDDIATDPKAWAALRAELTAGPFVDVNRLLVPAET